MKITLGSYEIEVKAKGIYSGSRNSKEDAMSWLNELAITYDEAARYNESIGCFAVAKDFDRKGKALFKFLDEAGCYNK